MYRVAPRHVFSALLTTTILAGPAQAACTTPSDFETTCTGNLSGGVDLKKVAKVTVEGLTADIKPALSKPGVDATNLTLSIADFFPLIEQDGSLSFKGEPFIVETTGVGIRYLFQALPGADGEDRSPVFGATGNDGDRGHNAFGATVTLRNAAVLKKAGGGISVTRLAAVLAESRGGDGGRGGKVLAGGGTATGGDGGVGGNGGAALVELGIDEPTGISVTGGVAPAVHALSVGGDGGDGGEGRVDTTGGAGTGGDGSRGGAGGSATVSLGGDLITVDGDASKIVGPSGIVIEYPVAGVLAQSLGGDGGDGAEGRNNVGGNGDGGDGARGGSGGAVAVQSRESTSVTITTTGTQAHHAIRAESLAGEGGDGGEGISSFIANGNGGDGGAGGTGGAVTVDVTGTLSTTGDEAQGIFARSYGGHGGDGGEGSAIFGEGENGAAAGSGPGGSVSITFEGEISTSGDDANAIFGHSVGGFSGDAAASKGFVAYGQGSASAGHGGPVTVTTAAGTSVSTTGDYSTGLTAQSVGGGGGMGSSASGVVALGGTGSSGGSGGAATVANDATVTTTGEGSRAIVAESRGGGGGDAGSAKSVVSIGADAGSGGSGGAVVVGNTGTLSTAGDSADGLYAASTGGGGGSAQSTDGIVALGGSGSSGGGGGTVDVTNSGTIATKGGDADAVFVQSLGGGGGDGSNTLGISVGFGMAIGGTGGGGGSGKAASYTDAGTDGYAVTTEGDRARGINVQSVGAGGGDGGNAITATLNPVISVGIGASGSGAHGGDGGSVSASVAGDVSTKGQTANAIQATSHGGGGGNAGTTVSASEGGLVSVAVAVGGKGGGGGVGGTAAVDASGAIVTEGDISHGVLSSSVGGGGGHSGVTVSATGASAIGGVSTSVGGSGGGGGSAAAVSASSTGSVETAGELSYGVNASSVGGGGGGAYFTGAFTGEGTASVDVGVGGSGGSGGSGGAVAVDTAGTITTAGAGSTGINASSIGGGGGDGSTTVDATGISGGTVDVNVGGSGGASGNGAAVTVTNDAAISTAGDLAEGIRAHSISKGGGNSGTVVGASGASFGNVGVTIGGSGGSGGTSGAVTVDSTGSIGTLGDYATAIDAKSLAGGGGNAKGSVTANGLSMGAIGVTVGGSGGSGGTAGDVSVSSLAALSTAGHHASGIVAQSHGGAGGEGGWSAQGSLTGGEFSGEASVTIGGGGGDGGQAGKVDVTTGSSIATSDVRSYGILAQSIGGNGGSGGNVYSGNVAVTTDESLQVNVGIGGGGGSGGKGGAVGIDNGASIGTDGFFASGILAQSIGGNGGTGGNVYTVVGTFSGGSTGRAGIDVGGNGGTGNDAGTVTVTNSGSITTRKGASAGIQAASLGGGGGVAGNAANINLSLAGPGEGSSVNLGVDYDVGGDGGVAGDGEAVSVVNTGTVATSGVYSAGIVGHSVGGGGGDGGTASSFTLNLNAACKAPNAAGSTFLCASTPEEGGEATSSSVSLSLSAEIGGGGGAAGNGGDVSLDNLGQVSTSGALSHALIAQSHGGGGGNGGVGDMGLAGWTTNSTANTIAKIGGFLVTLPNKFGFLSQSIVVGGSGGASGTGGAVDVTNSGFLSTTGDFSFGIHAQSVGGGGGNGAAGQNSFFGALTVGGAGSGGGDGGDVTISGPGAVLTTGFASVGIFAQSVGGGGGTAGDVSKAFSSAIGGLSFTDLNIGVGVGIQKDAGKGGDGGAVSVSTGAVTTTGDLSHGIFAHSVGGSGGVAGISGVFADLPMNFAGSNGDAGSAGPVSITLNGPMSVSGDGAYGIFAQSASGSGEDDFSGAVTIAVNDDLSVSGAGANAILAQSEGSPLVVGSDSVNGKIGITIAEAATVSSGAASAETIALRDGKQNAITNNGSLMHLGGPDAVVIATDGVTGLTMLNNGFLSGSISAAGTGLTNTAGGSFALGTSVDLGGSGTFLNSGLVSPGGIGPIGTSAITTGSFEQSDSGAMHVDVTYPSASDLIVLSGGDTASAATLAGTVQPSPIAGLPESGNSGLPKNGTTGAFAILQTGGRAIDSGALTVADTSTVEYDLSLGTQDDQPTLFLDFTVDYSPWTGSDATLAAVPGAVLSTANANHDEFAGHIDELIDLRQAEFEAGGTDLAFIDEMVLHFLTTEGAADLLDVYDRFAPAEIFAGPNAALFSSMRFADQLNSCPAFGVERVVVFGDEGQCAWARLTFTTTDRDRHGDSVGYEEDVFGISGGFQAEIAPNWFGGFAVGYENSEFDNPRFQGEADRFHAGAVLKRTLGQTTVSGSVSAGFSDGEMEREILTADGSLVARSDPDLWWVAGHARVSHDFLPGGDFRVTPWLDAGIEHQRQDSYTETGAGALGLSVEEVEQTFFTINPMVEVAGTAAPGGIETQFSARAGVLAITGNTERSTEVRLSGVSGAGPSFTVRDDLDPLYGSLGASIEARLSERTTLEASFDALLNDDQQTYSGGLRLNIAF